ncbi:hypothetical protein GCM10009775_32610 [Microbacterium aoyamense]|uniref:Uncharacterized protein n=1 Tax=Microbacterium aoyamense TaxID=344166 RepID=A0ABP5B9I6_9MICO|nr:hypothetical protein [Microbacterium aoyamense]
MHPLMYGYFLPDSVEVSREAAERHARRTRPEERARALFPQRLAFRVALQH